MAAAQGRLSDGTGNANGTDNGTDQTPQDAADQTPPCFRTAVDGLLSARLRPDIAIEPVRPPRRLAPYAYALEATVVDESDDEDLADGRLVLLHDPDGHEAWQGAFRLVTLVRAELEPEMAADPLLPEVCWSWLTGALQARGAVLRRAERHGHPRELALLRRARGAPGRRPRSRSARPGPRAKARMRHRTHAAHLAAWCDLLCQFAGLPPASPGTVGGVAAAAQRASARLGAH